MRLCPNCDDHSGHYQSVRCSSCGHDLLPEHISQELTELRKLVDEHEEFKTECHDTLREARQLLADTVERFTDEAVGRAMRKLGQLTDQQAKDIANATNPPF